MKKSQIFMLIALMFITVFVFYPVLNAEFINLDDRAMVTENWKIYSFSKDNLKALLFEPHYKLYHPILNLTFAVEYSLAGADPYLYHANNLIIHLLNTLLIFFLLRILSGGNFFAAFIAAFIFACHPLHVEAVAWVSSRKDTLYAFFYLSSLLLYLKAYESKKRTFLITFSLLLFLCACLSKPMAVTLPAIMILCDWLLGKKRDKRSLIIYAVYFAAALVFSVTTFALYYTQSQRADLTFSALLINFISAHYNFLFYMAKFLYPAGLSPLYPYFFEPSSSAIPGFIIKAPFFLYAVILLVLFSLKYTKKIFFGFFFFLITILPVINIFPTGIAAVADRYTYVPLVGFAYIAAWAIVFLYSRLKRYRLGFIITVAVLCVFTVMCFSSRAYCKKWTDTKTLFDYVINQYPGQMAKPYSIRGSWLLENGNFEKAKNDFEQAASIKSDANILFYLAGIKKDEQKYDEALKLYDSLPLNSVNNVKIFTHKAQIHYNAGNKEKAYEILNNAITMLPNEYLLYFTLALFYVEDNNFEKAYENIQNAIRFNPKNKGIYLNAAKICEYYEKYELAEKEYFNGLKHCGYDRDIMYNFGEMYFKIKLFNDAEQIFEHMVRIYPDEYRAYDRLGSIAGFKNDFGKAIYNFTTAILINTNYGQAYLHRAAVYLRKGNYDKAAQDTAQAKKIGIEIPDEYVQYIEKRTK